MSGGDEISERIGLFIRQAIEPKTDSELVIVATEHTLHHGHGGFDGECLKIPWYRKPQSALRIDRRIRGGYDADAGNANIQDSHGQ
jgi:hypothetical protein